MWNLESGMGGCYPFTNGFKITLSYSQVGGSSSIPIPVFSQVLGDAWMPPKGCSSPWMWG